MELWKRIRAAFTEKVAGQLEDPYIRLERAHRDNLALLQLTRRNLDEAITTRSRFEQQSSEMRRRAEQLDREAAQALKAGDEKRARKALEQKIAVLDGVPEEEDLRMLRIQEEDLAETLEKLTRRAEQLRQRLESSTTGERAGEGLLSRAGNESVAVEEEVETGLGELRNKAEQPSAAGEKSS